MKKIIQILLICLMIAGIIVIATVGFNVGIKYSKNTQISINIGKQFEIKDIKEITNQVFQGQQVLIQQVELYKDMVQITVKEATDEQVAELNTKINEKYELENEVSDIDIAKNANVRLKNILKPYILPVSIVSIATVIWAMIIFRKLGIWAVLYTTAMNIVAPQAILVSLYAVTRLPINRLTSVISVIIYIASITLTFTHLYKVKSFKEVDANKSENK